MNIFSKKWAYRHLELAKLVSTWSKDTSTKVGCVIVNKRGLPLSWGYNGNPMGVKDTDERFMRPLKYHYVAHAEKNALNLCRSSVDDCIMFVTHAPCSICAGSIIQCGISDVIVDAKNGFTDDESYLHKNDKWKESATHSLIMFNETKTNYFEFDDRGLRKYNIDIGE